MLRFKKITTLTGISGVLLSVLSFAPCVLADAPAITGGLAGSASFSITNTAGTPNTSAINGAGVSSAIGENGAAAWSFNSDGPGGAGAVNTNSAGSMGSQGTISIGTGAGFTAVGVSKVVDGGTPLADDKSDRQANSFAANAGPDLQLGDSNTTAKQTVITMP